MPPVDPLAALVASGPTQVSVVQRAQWEAMARRAAGYQGEARRAIEHRLIQLMSEVQATPPETTDGSSAAPPSAAPAARPLAALLTLFNPALPMSSSEEVGTANPTELKTVRVFRDTWRQLSVDQRIAQALGPLPAQSGPLNTERLLHQALGLMRDTAPGYLQHFVAHVDALMALERAQPVASPRAKPKRPSGTGRG